MRGGLPFEVTIPRCNAITRAAIADMESNKGQGLRGKEVRAALADLKSDDGEGDDE
jgi:antitoxin component of RelBE/YafQ-DinJ toxin-antitoxin module